MEHALPEVDVCVRPRAAADRQPARADAVPRAARARGLGLWLASDSARGREKGIVYCATRRTAGPAAADGE